MLVTLMAMLPTATAFATSAPASYDNSSVQSLQYYQTVREDPSKKLTIATQTVSKSGDNFTVTIDIPAGETARSIYFLGNKEGGGANTSLIISGHAVINFTEAPINGQWYRISYSGLNFTGSTTITLQCSITSSGTYNSILVVVFLKFFIASYFFAFV